MSKLYVFREFISEILSTAALDIFGVVENTLIEYKEEISRSEEERKRLQRLLNVVTQPNIAGSSSTVHFNIITCFVKNQHHKKLKYALQKR